MSKSTDKSLDYLIGRKIQHHTKNYRGKNIVLEHIIEDVLPASYVVVSYYNAGIRSDFRQLLKREGRTINAIEWSSAYEFGETDTRIVMTCAEWDKIKDLKEKYADWLTCDVRKHPVIYSGTKTFTLVDGEFWDHGIAYQLERDTLGNTPNKISEENHQMRDIDYLYKNNIV